MPKVELTDEEFRELTSVADKLPDATVSEELQRLAERERDLIAGMDPAEPQYERMREVMLYNMTILSTASSRLGRT
jgi:hypothetical protein